MQQKQLPATPRPPEFRIIPAPPPWDDFQLKLRRQQQEHHSKNRLRYWNTKREKRSNIRTWDIFQEFFFPANRSRTHCLMQLLLLNHFGAKLENFLLNAKLTDRGKTNTIQFFFRLKRGAANRRLYCDPGLHCIISKNFIHFNIHQQSLKGKKNNELGILLLIENQTCKFCME